jgi:hypothetical protein
MRNYSRPPDTEPSGALDPPRRWPPTGVGTETPMPPREPVHRAVRSRVGLAMLGALHRVERVLLGAGREVRRRLVRTLTS